MIKIFLIFCFSSAFFRCRHFWEELFAEPCSLSHFVSFYSFISEASRKFTVGIFLFG